ncbi:hypothetical protein B0H11DRAFT_1690867, partial [Mycena galericulata]
HVKSKTKATQISRDVEDSLKARAVALYFHKQGKVLENRGKKMSLWAVCKKVEDKHRVDTGKEVKLDTRTLLHHVKGGKTKSTSNAEKGWLLPEEVDLVVQFATEVANRGFPLSHKHLKEHVDEICQTRLGDKFLESGVGKNW